VWKTNSLVITATRTLKSQPFNPGDDLIATGQAWDNWLKEIKWAFRYFKITEPLDKKDALIIYGRKEIARLEKSLPNPTVSGDDYGKLRKKLNDYFKTKKNKQHARYVFLKMRPAHGEATNAYAAHLREKANDCEFEASCDEQILEHLIQTTQNQLLIQKAINNKWNLTQFLTEAAQIEDILIQIREMKNPQEVKKPGRQFKKRRRPKIKQSGQGKQPCGYCGQTGTLKEGKNCPVYGKKCTKCQKFNPFSSVYKSKGSPNSKN